MERNHIASCLNLTELRRANIYAAVFIFYSVFSLSTTHTTRFIEYVRICHDYFCTTKKLHNSRSAYKKLIMFIVRIRQLHLQYILALAVHTDIYKLPIHSLKYDIIDTRTVITDTNNHHIDHQVRIISLA